LNGRIRFQFHQVLWLRPMTCSSAVNDMTASALISNRLILRSLTPVRHSDSGLWPVSLRCDSRTSCCFQLFYRRTQIFISPNRVSVSLWNFSSMLSCSSQDIWRHMIDVRFYTTIFSYHGYHVHQWHFHLPRWITVR
jgi:hypothetical protein